MVRISKNRRQVLKTECISEVCKKFTPIFRGWGKSNMSMAIFSLDLYNCMDTDEARVKFREMVESIYGEDNEREGCLY